MATKKKVARRARRPASKPATRKSPAGTSQAVEDGVWYYEGRGSLLFVAWTLREPGKRQVRQFRLRWSKLVESAARCGWKLTRPKQKAQRLVRRQAPNSNQTER